MITVEKGSSTILINSLVTVNNSPWISPNIFKNKLQRVSSSGLVIFVWVLCVWKTYLIIIIIILLLFI